MIQDGVHPGAVGQTVMAVAIIDNMVARRRFRSRSWRRMASSATGANGAITDFNKAAME